MQTIATLPFHAHQAPTNPTPLSYHLKISCGSVPGECEVIPGERKVLSLVSCRVKE